MMRTSNVLTYSIFICLFFLITLKLNAQMNDYELKTGIKLNGLLPQTEFETKKLEFSYLADVYLRFELSSVLEVEASAGFGTLASRDFVDKTVKSNIIPVDLKLIISPYENAVWNPYAFGGIGALYFDVTSLPMVQSPQHVEEEGWGVFIPFGGGVEFVLSNSLLLDVNIGYNYTFTDDLNYYNNKDLSSNKSTADDGYYNLGIGITFVSGSGESDSDNDGLTKNEEIELGTNPNNPDSDNDGLTDGEEIKKYLTSPFKKDSDEDLLIDYAEVVTHSTDPNKVDTDNDGLTDGDELLIYNTDPLINDSDNDKLNDGDEIIKHHTNPNNPDTDGDGLNDGKEITQTLSNPLELDTDGDKISDSDEVNIYATDPSKSDTDDGSVDDFTEIERGTNPKNPKDDKILDASKVIILEGITFARNSAELESTSQETLQKVLNTLNAYPEMKVEIRGYTDSRGDRYYNMRLSQRRADTVKNWLVGNGISSARVRAIGYGPDNPITTNSTADGRRRNRRIEFVNISQ
jgi:outer membrane protein OmpA-like peptidoglycan-associated protein